ncbi:ribosome hibernation-promoting factor, HPF/YfiA family [[Mycoplasma] testudinis]|uniref:ribosome hibernation-promoting factor, HPF/YfiA family n=1 Tax=[Mycoplasma] testudinis TaxID=33924 RepID=UPI000481E650|nr:ribosome-associated translation inhibitor RaiA [[Mycoplasma] testudinis]
MLNIRWKDCSASDAVTSHFETKLSKILRFKMVDVENIKAEVVKYEKENRFTVRLNTPIIKGSIIRSEAKADDVLTAINEVIEKSLDQIRRVKTKRSINK